MSACWPTCRLAARLSVSAALAPAYDGQRSTWCASARARRASSSPSSAASAHVISPRPAINPVVHSSSGSSVPDGQKLLSRFGAGRGGVGRAEARHRTGTGRGAAEVPRFLRQSRRRRRPSPWFLSQTHPSQYPPTHSPAQQASRHNPEPSIQNSAPPRTRDAPPAAGAGSSAGAPRPERPRRRAARSTRAARSAAPAARPPRQAGRPASARRRASRGRAAGPGT